jgi:hypothetical protein
MELSDSHKISQEKRDFKIIDVLITAWSRVQVLAGPPYSSYSNLILYEKGFGYVFCLQEVLRKDYSAHKPECERMRR